MANKFHNKLQHHFKMPETLDLKCNVPITLPVLKDVTEPQPALGAGDWLSELMPLISDMSEGASTWWTETLQQAQDPYGQWLAASPLDKMSVQPNTMVKTRYKR